MHGFRTQANNAAPSSNGVCGSAVKNLQGETIGLISELVVDHARAKVVFVIIELAEGFSRVTQRCIAIRWNSLRLNLDAEDTSTPYLVELTRTQLRAAPRLDGASFTAMCRREVSYPTSGAEPRVLRLTRRGRL